MNLCISKGKEIKTVTMVSLTGMTRAQAESAIQKLNLKVGSVVSVNSDEDKGKVVFQSVKQGAEVEIGTKVNIQISKGPKKPDNPPDNGDDDPGTPPAMTIRILPAMTNLSPMTRSIRFK